MPDLSQVSPYLGPMYTKNTETQNAYNSGLSRAQQLYNAALGPEAQKQGFDNLRSDAQKEVLDRYRDQSRGLSAQENASARANFESRIRNAGATARTQLGNNLAGRGLGAGGGYAASQRASLEGALADQLMSAERQLLLDNVSATRSGLDSYANALNSQESNVYNQLLNNLNFASAGGQQALDQWNAEQQLKLQRELARQQRRSGGLFGRGGFLGTGIGT